MSLRVYVRFQSSELMGSRGVVNVDSIQCVMVDAEVTCLTIVEIGWHHISFVRTSGQRTHDV